MVIFHSLLYVYLRVLVANNGHSKGTSVGCQVLAGDAAVSGGVLPSAVSGNEDAEFAQLVQEPLRRCRGCRGMMMVRMMRMITTVNMIIVENICCSSFL